MEMRKNLPLIIGLGASWGLVEATLGWGMHLLHIPFRSLILFPIGLFFMLYGVVHTGQARTAFHIAAMAALIKMTNLLMPGQFPFYYVMNPAMAILLEGSAVFAFSYFFKTSSPKGRLNVFEPWLGATGLVILMQMAFTGWQVLMSAATVENPALARMLSVNNILPFLLQSVLKGGALLLVARLLEPSGKGLATRLNWTWSVSLVIMALIVDYITL